MGRRRSPNECGQREEGAGIEDLRSGRQPIQMRAPPLRAERDEAAPYFEADSGIAALRSIMTRDFAVILLDVRMPMMNGIETASHIRRRRQSEMTPIIFITAYEPDEMVSTQGYAEGAVDFIFAPLSFILIIVPNPNLCLRCFIRIRNRTSSLPGKRCSIGGGSGGGRGLCFPPSLPR